jgi:hypothetical protein
MMYILTILLEGSHLFIEHLHYNNGVDLIKMIMNNRVKN